MTANVVERKESGRVVPRPRDYMPTMTVEEATNRFSQIADFVRSVMRSGIDYGLIPGASKPTLLKPGAEKLCTLFGLTVADPVILTEVEDWTGKDYGGEPFFYYKILQRLLRGGEIVASQFASCNSRESKYRWRQGERTCPSCGLPAIIRGKEEYGGGWICFKKKGGCGSKFVADDQQITTQQVGRVVNPDIYDQVNTIQKMAAKRAMIAATLVAVNASEFFTQDMEDLIIEGAPPVEPVQQEPRKIVPVQTPIDARLSTQHRARLVGLYRAVKLREEITAIRDEVRRIQQAGEITPADLNIVKAEHEAALARCPVAPATAPEPQPVAAATDEADIPY